MPEGLSPQEVGKEIAEHAKHGGDDRGRERRDRLLSITEAVLLSIVALLAAWSGYAAAKWSTESRVALAEASTARTEASRADLEAMELRNFDSSTFEAWFAAYTAGSERAMAVAERRFRPEFRVAFDAWLQTRPFSNPDAPPGPSFMPEYHNQQIEHAAELNERATEASVSGTEARETADRYVRLTVLFATVLFLVAISQRFTYRAVRLAATSLAGALMIFALIGVITLPRL